MRQGYRSGLEWEVAEHLDQLRVPYEYEAEKISYTTPPTPHTYTPDFKITSATGKTIYVETKGRFVCADRKKHILVKQQHPELDLRFVFQNPNGRISKGSKTTYAMWCDKHGFMWAKRSVPVEWLDE